MNYKPYMNVSTGLWAFDKGDGMTELNLLDALIARLSAIFSNYKLTAKGAKIQAVKVYAQYLPQPSSITVKPKDDSEAITPQGYTYTDAETLFPCVIVKLVEATDSEEGTLTQTRVNVNILVGVYDAITAENERKLESGEEEELLPSDCQGYRDVLNIIEVIRQDLLTLPGRVLDQRYRLEMPLKNYLFEDQPWPIYFGQIESVWETGRPLMPRNFEGVCANGRR